jgi:PAS domain S-box-containing protein
MSSPMNKAARADLHAHLPDGRMAGQADQKLRLYETLLANTPDLVYVFGLDHRFTYANNALLAMWGKTWEEAAGKNCLELGYEPWHAAMHGEEIDRVVATRQPIRGEVPFNGTNGRRIYDYIFVPVFGPDGDVEAVAGTTRDVTERSEYEEALLQSEERFRAMVTASSDVLYRMNADWTVMHSMQGRDFLADLPAPTDQWLSRYVHPADLAMVQAAVQRSVASGEVFELEHRVHRVDGTPGWTFSRAIPLRDAQGVIREWFGAASDITARKQHEEHQKLLIDELNHRVKNTLAVVQSMAAQSLRNAAEGPRLQFEGRLRALSKAHDVLTREHWTGASLHTVVQDALAHCASHAAGRLRASGPDVWVMPKHALALAMALHELCTNAQKYGSLSNDDGFVTIAWDVVPASPGDVADAGDMLTLRWTEAGGPPVIAPQRHGFGTRLIERGLAHDLCGEVSLRFEPAGVECVIRAPMDEQA